MHLEKILRNELETLNKQSTGDTVNMQQVLLEIDNQHFIDYVSQIICEVSSGDETKRIKAHELMKLALRSSFLLDLYSETNNPIYLEEAEKQLSELYHLVPQKHHRDLKSMEKKARIYFDLEKKLRSRIKAADSFTGEDIRQYLDGKSGDALFYGRLLKTIIPAWNLTSELRIQTMLFDIVEDIIDYEDDIKHGLPNVLYLFLSGSPGKNKIPQDMRGAIRLANELGVSNRILKLATRLKGKALASKDLDRSPTLRETIIDHYDRIEQLLRSELK